ncbi:MAG: helix-turn-helix domain-containing protein [Actinomycetes bacterium]
MARKLDYRWHLRQVMAARGMFATTDLIEPLAARGIGLSSSQVYRLVVDRPERLSLKVLMALMDILDCSMGELIEPVASGATGAGGRRHKKAGGTESSIGELRPSRARIIQPGT